ncbi:hypothetical protein AB0F72_03650 [Actinoplanes sp. NPDC023936]|uniref:hypothetical protein n=1 Tax=Actinoplanes sp. NPDC023936 TaxID=3154910 RepID=UPI0033CA0B12
MTPDKTFANVDGMPPAKKPHEMSYVDAGGELRRYTGAFLIMCGIAPLLMFSLLASKPGGPAYPILPSVVAGPFIIIGVVVTALGIFTKEPKRSAKRVGVGAGLIILGVILIFGIRAAIV